MKKEYEIELTIVRCAFVHASNAKEAKKLAQEDIEESIMETQVFPEDMKIVSTRKIKN